MYLAVCARVNRRFIRDGQGLMMGLCATLIAFLSLAMSGCGSPLRSFEPASGGIGVGVCYSPEKALRSSPKHSLAKGSPNEGVGAPSPLEVGGLNEDGLAVVNRDFANIQKMRIDVVLLRDVSASNVKSILELAHEHDLKLVLPDAGAVRRVRGMGKHAADGQRDLRLPNSPIVVGHYLGHIVDEVTYRRARTEAVRVTRSHPDVATFVRIDSAIATNEYLKAFDYVIAHDSATGSPSEKIQTPGVLQTLRLRGNQHGDDATVRTWLLEYHRGLARGRTGGLIIEDFRTLPGDEAGLVLHDAPLSPERISMVQRITSRAKRWRSALGGLAPSSVEAMTDPPSGIDIALLAKGNRRCLLITNTSTGEFARGDVILPIELNGTPVVRAVAVPVGSATVLGKVIRARKDRLVIPVKLAPGDAELYELF